MGIGQGWKQLSLFSNRFKRTVILRFYTTYTVSSRSTSRH
jgi:hypothetical protein